MEQTGTSQIISQLTEAINKISYGNYSEAVTVFDLSRRDEENPEISELAEAVGLMSVKLEGREYKLEQVIEDLKSKKAQLEEESKTRLIFTVILSIVIIGFSFYTFVMAIMRDQIDLIRSSTQFRAYLNYSLTFFFFMLMVIGIKVSGRTRTDFGLSLSNWRASVVDGIIYSLPWMIAATIIKWYMITYNPAFAGKGLINLTSEPVSMYLIYLVFLSFQEFFARGMLQGPMEYCLAGKHAKWLAIVMSSIVFGASHLHYSILMASVSALSGILFGWLYSRHKTLVAPITSHFLIGSWALGPLGFMPYFLIA